MKLRIKYNVGRWIMWGYGGRVLYPFILFRKARKNVPDWLFRHELEHIYQIRRMGYLWFHIKYLYLLIRHWSYDKHPFELEATKRQDDLLTDKEKELRT